MLLKLAREPCGLPKGYFKCFEYVKAYLKIVKLTSRVLKGLLKGCLTYLRYLVAYLKVV
jgi:hypothetical protein